MLEISNLEFLKNKLLPFGITLSNYCEQTGNLVGNINVPNALKSFNKNLTEEQAFYLVANKVFELANILAYGIPFRLSADFKNVVGFDVYRDFQKAIFEEVNMRFLSNAFPEFSSAGNMTLSNQNITPSYIGGPNLRDWVNPMSAQIILNIEWRQFDDDADLIRDRVYMYRNMENADFTTGDKRILQVLEDGTVSLEQKSFFAQQTNLETTNKKLEQTNTISNQNTSEINNIKSTILNLATKDYVNSLVTKFPKIKKYDQDHEYELGDFCVHNQKIYFSEQDHNMNNIPGGISGVGWWAEIANVFIPKQETNVIYVAGTDIKKCYKNPNPIYYISLKDLINNSIDHNWFEQINQTHGHLNLTQNDVNKFMENLCNNDLNIFKDIYDQVIFHPYQTIFFKDQNDFNAFKRMVGKVYWTGFELRQDIDYELLQNDRYLLNASNETLGWGGDYYISNSNIVGTWISSDTRTGNFVIQSRLIHSDYGTSGYITTLQDEEMYVGGFVTLSRYKDSSRAFDINISAAGGTNFTGNVSPNYGDTQLTYTLDHNHSTFIGASSPTKFSPRYQTIFGVRFKIPITKFLLVKNWNLFANIVDLTITGNIVKTEHKETSELEGI